MVRLINSNFFSLQSNSGRLHHCLLFSVCIYQDCLKWAKIASHKKKLKVKKNEREEKGKQIKNLKSGDIRFRHAPTATRICLI